MRPAALPIGARVYVGAVIALGAISLVAFVPRMIPQPRLALACLAAMVLASVLKLRLSLGVGQVTVSMAYVIDFMVLLTMGADMAMTIAALGVLVQCTVGVRSRQPWYRTAFSVAAVVIAVRAAGGLWDLAGGTVTDLSVVMLLLLVATVYYVLNSGLVAGAIALASAQRWFSCWGGFVPTAPGYFAAAALVGGISLALSAQAYWFLAVAAAMVIVGHVVQSRLLDREAEHTATV